MPGGSRSLVDIREPTPRARAVAVISFSLILCLFTPFLASIGAQAIRDQHCEWTLRQSSTIGPIAIGSTSSREQLNGIDAVAAGVAFLAASVVTLAWATGLILHLTCARARLATWPVFWCIYCWAIIALLAVVGLGLAPPWRPASILLYLTVCVWLAFVAGVAFRRIPPGAGALVFAGVIAASLVMGIILGATAAWFIVGTLGTFVALGHLQGASPVAFATFRGVPRRRDG